MEKTGTQTSNLKEEVQGPKSDDCDLAKGQEGYCMRQSRQYRDMKLHVPGLRRTTGYLIVMLCIQVSLCVTEAANDEKQPEGQDIQAHGQSGVQPWKNRKHDRGTVHLLTDRGPDGKVVPLHEDGFYIWMVYHKTSTFKLEDNSTSLVVRKTGLYILNLKMYYRVPIGYKCNGTLLLFTCINKYPPSYPKGINVIKSIDTMQCVDQWCQSVTLSQVVKLEKGTKLRVMIRPENYDFIIGDDSTYFSVTLL